jgi:hypothetical protein
MPVDDVEVQRLSNRTRKTWIDLVIGLDRAQAAQLVGSADGVVSSPATLIRHGDQGLLINASAGSTMRRRLSELPANRWADSNDAILGRIEFGC